MTGSYIHQSIKTRLIRVVLAILFVVSFNFSFAQEIPDNVQWPVPQPSMRGPIAPCGTGVGEIPFTVQIVSDSSYNGYDITCSGACTGYFTAIVTGGSGDFTFFWQGNGDAATRFNQTWEAVCDQGNIQVIVTDVIQGISCGAFHNPTVPNSPVPLNFVFTDPACPGSCDGSANASVVFGVPPYSYSWSSGPGGLPINTLCAGTHTLVITDDNGCIVDTTITIFDPPAISPNLTVYEVSCNNICDGSIAANPTGGNGAPYTYSWAGAPIDDPLADSATGLCELVNYTVTVTDPLGCTGVASATVPDKDSITIAFVGPVAPLCFNSCDGQIGVVIAGGSSTYVAVEWFEGLLGSGTPFTPTGIGAPLSANNLCGLTDYYVRVTDSRGCQDSIQMPQLIPPTELVTDTVVTDLVCFGDGNGAIDITPSGGTIGPGYTYEWSIVTPGAGIGNPNAEDQTTLSGGEYRVIVTDANGCKDTLHAIPVLEPTEIFANGVVTDITCFDQLDGMIDITTTGGNGPYTWAWTSSVTGFVDPGTEDLMALDSGCYTLTITDVNACTLTGGDTTLCIVKPAEVYANATLIQNVDCNGNGNGLITLSAENGVAPYRYDMNQNGDFNEGELPILSGLSPGAYTVSVRDANDCQKDTTINITQPNPLVLTETHSDLTCFQADDGSINLTITGGSQPIPVDGIVWSPAPTPIANDITNPSGLSAGNYTVTVTDANGCVASLLITIIEPVELIVDLVYTDLLCFGDLNGTIDVTTSGGVPGYTWTWTSTNPGFVDPGTEDLSGLDAGTYCLSALDAGGCQRDSCVTINEPDPIYFTGTTVTQVTCFGVNGGAIDLTVTGGTLTSPDYTYSWAPNGETTQDISGLAPDMYIATITDDNLCTTDTTIVLNPVTEILLSTSSSQSSCNSANGSVTAVASGGTGVLSYEWRNSSGVIVGTTPTVNNLGPDCYDAYVTDQNLCTVTLQECLTDQGAPTVTFTPVNSTCANNCNGSITISISGGLAPYNTTWLASVPFVDPGTDDIFNLCEGDYTLTVTDANGCIFTQTTTLTDPLPIISDAVITEAQCYGDPTGAINITPSGGTEAGAYDYSWTGPGFSAVTEDLNGLTSGTYCVRITDDNACYLDTCYAVGQANLLLASATSSSAQCGLTDGTATVTHVGGTPNYTYAWYDATPTLLGSTTDTQTGLGLGTYTVEVTDANNCVATTTVSVSEITGPTITVDTVLNASCNGYCNGLIQTTIVNISGNPYTISWSHGPVVDDVIGLCAGAYTITVTDDVTGCAAMTSITITEPDVLVVPGTGVNDACYQSGSGSINITPTGGTAPYYYDWNNDGTGDFDDVEDLSGLLAGTYNIMVRDSNSCVAVNSFTIGEATAIASSTATNTSTCGIADGEASVAVTDGTPGYSYAWYSAGTLAPQLSNNDTLTGVMAGCYDVVVTDANNCISTNSACISSGGGPVINSTVVDVTCNGGSDGSITTGVVAPTINWTGPNGFTSTSADISGLSAGVYTIAITDAGGCSSGLVDTVAEPVAISLSGVITNPTCAGQFSGAIDLTVTDAVPAYNVSWTGPNGYTSSSEDITNLEAGQYCVTITDGNGCTAASCFNVNDPIAIILSTNVAPTQCTAPTGAVSVNVSGVSAPYTYAWTDDVGTPLVPGNDFIQTDLPAGIYIVQVTDTYGCVATEQDTILNSNAPTITLISVNDVNCFGGTDGDILISVAGGTIPYDFDWDNNGVGGGDPEDLTGVAAGSYSLLLTDGAGCTSTISDVINEPTQLTLTGVSTDLTCNGDNSGAVDITVGGGVTTYNFDWTNAGVSFSSSEDVNGLAAGTYDVLVTDANGCTITDTYTLTEPTAITLAGASVNATCLVPDGEASVVAGGGSPGYTYVWTDVTAAQPGTVVGGNSDVLSNVLAGSYQVLVTDLTGCSDSTIIAISDNGAATITSVVTDVLCFGNANGAIDITASEALTYVWSGPAPFPGATTEDISGVEAGTYTVSGTNIGGCVANSVIVVGGPTAPISVVTSLTDLTCYNDASGAIDITISGGTPGYSVSWSGPNGYTSNFEDISSLDSGTYDITVTDINMCNYTNSYDLTQPDSLQIVATSVNPTCGLTDGQISVVVSGGTLNYAYQWTNLTTSTLLGTTDTESNIGAGNYQIDVTDGAMCTNSLIVPLSDANGAPLSATTTDVLCSGDANGTIDLTITGSNTYTILWSTANGSGLVPADEDQSGLTVGTYDVIVTDDVLGCTSALSVDILEPNVLALTEVLTDLSCNGDGSGAIDITVAGGTLPYSYVWSTLDGSGLVPGVEDQTGLSAGTYDIVVTDANNCTVGGSYTLIEPQPILVTAVVVDDSCNQGMTGDIDITVTQGVFPYTFSWTDSGSYTSSNEDIHFLGAEVYSLTIFDNNMCQKDTMFTIAEPSAILADVTVTNSNCTLSDGAAVSNASGGTLTSPDYTYDWQSGGLTISTTSQINAVPSGIYTLQIVDDMGCQLDTTVTINDIGAPTISVNSVTDVSCFGGSDGAIDISAASANLPLNYVWNPGAISQSEDLSNAPADVYTVGVSDVLGCTSFATVTVNEPTEITATYTSTDATCGICNGDATVVIVGGTPGYTHLWSDGQSSDFATGLCAGVYTDQVTDGNGCVQNIDVAISNTGGPTGETITTVDVICAGDNSGSADVVAVGGVAPYNYYWPGIPANGGSQANLSAGTYFVEMTDANSCIRVAQVDILDGVSIVATSIIDPATCGGSDGNITVNASGGIGALSYAWNPPLGITTPSLNGYPEGIYVLTITDGTCSVNETFTIPGIDAPTLSLVGVNTNCYADSTGSITSSVVDNVGAMTYQWYDDLGNPIVGEVNQDISNIPIGTYILEGTDGGNGCIAFASVTIDQPDSINLSISTVADASCAGVCDGSASVVASGGTLGYTYTWSSGLSTTNTATGMCAGSDTVLITDAMGCMVTTEVVVSEPFAISYVLDSVTDAYCVNTNDGAIYITANGGAGSYTYSWSSIPTGFVDPGTDDITGLFPMTYVVTISDGSGCSISDSIPVDTTNVIYADAGLDSNFCAGNCITLIGTAVGTLSYTTEWLDSTGTSISTNDSLNVCSSTAGSLQYVLQVSDGNCTHVDTVDVVVNPSPEADAGGDYLEIHGTDVTLGGSPTGPQGATYSWTPTTNFVNLSDSTVANPSINLIENGEYIVTVTDANGCTATDTVDVEVVPQIVFPNGFSPNGDGVNDTWQIDNMSEFPESVVEVYNRWGQQLFISVGYVQEFDGTYKGKKLPVGTYYYIITLNHPKYPDAYTGPITIMR